MKFRLTSRTPALFVAVIAAPLALAACSDSDDAAYESDTETVEIEANEALGFKADLRHYGVGAQILFDLGIRKIRLMTNNPKKIVGLSGYGLEVVERVKIEIPPNKVNAKYLATKRNKLGHLLDLVGEDLIEGNEKK